jgi:hypothetical protein
MTAHRNCSFNQCCFPVGHSIPGAWGIETTSGWVIYSGDLRLHGKRADLTRRFIKEAACSGSINIDIAEPASTGINVEWYRIIGRSNPDYGRYVQQTSDGGYIITGYVNEPLGILALCNPANIDRSKDSNLCLIKIGGKK